MSLIHLEHLEKLYRMGTETVYALRDISLNILKGEYTAIMGQSGSGR